jgi:hypothetical protein
MDRIPQGYKFLADYDQTRMPFRIGPLHLFAWLVNEVVLRIREEKPRFRVTILISPCLKTLSAKHRPQFSDIGV